MQETHSIVRQPILITLLLSAAVHAVLLYSRTIYVPPAANLESGRTVVQLTLLPSIDAPSAAPEPRPEPVEKERLQSQPQPAPSMIEQEARPEPRQVPEPAEQVTEETPASIERDASMEIHKGVTANALATSAFHPTYPRVSRRRGEEGTVVLSVHIRANGFVDNVAIVQSSGYRRLDDAAIAGARQTPFTPALQLGHAVDSTTELSYTFRLTDD